MRMAFLGVIGIGAAVVGCGAKVTVDSGSGGAGGAASSSSGTPTDTTGAGTTCGSVSCAGASDGSCDCQGVCNSQKLEVQCVPVSGGGSCTCSENGIKIAVCTQAGAASCNFTTECCAAQFFGGSTGAGG